eukprot:jgi/Ulvmu1/8132/UM040_0028.1
MRFFAYSIFVLGAVLAVSGQSGVSTAGQLAEALRAGQRWINLDTTITGHHNEQAAATTGQSSATRYGAFLEVPQECVPDPAACSSTEGYVHVAVPTTITGSRDALWDVGFLRRRIIVSQDVTIDSMRLQGFVSGRAPYVLWFFFTNGANLICNNCTIEHDCAGGSADYFMQDVGLDALSQGTVKVSEDGTRAWGTVPMRAQDAALGTTSVQLFQNSTWVCRQDAPPEPTHVVEPDTTLRPSETCQFAANEGRSYRGIKNTTRSGNTCQRWDASQPNAHDRTPARYPSAGLLDNYCRNPDDGSEVWCYTADSAGREPCGVPLCEDEQAAGSGGGGDGADVNGEGDAMQRRRMAAVVGITSTAVVVAVFAILVVACMAWHRLRREARDRERFRKVAHSYPLPAHPLVISDSSSNAHWIRSQSTTAEAVRQEGDHQGTPHTAPGGPPPPVGASMQRLFSCDGQSPGARRTERALWTQPAECVHVWTPPTGGQPEVTSTAPSSSGMWEAPRRCSMSRWSGMDADSRSVQPDGPAAGTVDGSLPSVWTALALTTDSPPAQLLEAQLEWLSYHEDGRLLEYLQLVPHLGLRAGGQGAVAFAQHQNAASRLFALKFFCSNDAFEIEKQASMLPELRALMPPVELVEQRPEELAAATARMPWPLSARPLPPVIVTEKGESLDDFVRRSAPDFFTSLQVMVHIAEKLQQLHAAGWTHRDLKPGNAIWLPSKNSWTLIDFGCAARIGEEAPLGFSLYYAPPEVVQAYDGGRKTTLCAAAADVWALGVICWELLTKQRFYGAGARSHTVIAQLCGRAALPTEGTICSDLCRRLGGSRLCASILAMLSRAPEHRPSVGELLHQWKSVFGEPDIA